MTEPSRSDSDLLPLFLKLADLPILVVGGGTIATKKALELVETGARVRVVAPQISADISALAQAGRLQTFERGYEPSDLDETWLVFAATSSPEVQATVAGDAMRARVFCIAMDNVSLTRAYSASVLRRPPFVVAISSTGAAPALTRLLREILESALPAQAWVEYATELRARWKSEGTPIDARFGELLAAFVERLRVAG